MRVMAIRRKGVAVPITVKYIYSNGQLRGQLHFFVNCVSGDMLLLSLEESRNVSPCLVCTSPAGGGVCVLFMT